LITWQIGHPTVIINNAGVVQGKLILDLSAADVKQLAITPAPRIAFSLSTLCIFRTFDTKCAVTFLDHQGLPP